MQVFQVQSFATPPRMADAPMPQPGPGQVRLRIMACGLNHADLLLANGTYQDLPPLPFTLGMELAGIVDQLGPGVTFPAIGTRVAVFAGSGGLATHGCFAAGHCIPLPDAMSFEQAAGFLIAYGTSHLALTHRANLRPGETLLVLGAAGGVGLTAVQVGKQLGARVIAVARGADKLAVARAAGADCAFNSETPDLRQQIKALGGADVVYDPVGGTQFTQAFRATNPLGRILVIGFASGQVPPVPANILLVKNIDLLGFYWGGYRRFAPDLLTGSLATLFTWFNDGRIAPQISQTLPFDQAADALALLESRAATGKIVVRIARP